MAYARQRKCFLAHVRLPYDAQLKSKLIGHSDLDNGTGAPPGWNWMLSFLFTSNLLVGFDAAGHIAEETKNARSVRFASKNRGSR